MLRIEHPVVDDDDTISWKGLLQNTDHTVIRVPDLETAIRWYEQVLGLAVVEASHGHAYLASPVTGTIILGLREDGTGLASVNFRARTSTAFDLLGSKLDNAGIATTVESERQRPGVLETLSLTIPTGHTFEIVRAETDPPAAPVSGEYRPGAIDVRTSHLQLRTTDVKHMTEFLSVMGFRSSTFVSLPGSDGFFIQFLRINEFHHQIAILTGQNGVHHVALELDEADFWRFLDNLQMLKNAAEYGPVRHHEGNMLSIYVRDPFGNRIEITSTMETVGFDYAPTAAGHEPWYHMNMWGPQPPESWETEWM
ncbi:catechol 2,3-dioxygenase [Rhodococcoides trifolii]|uniref:Catechol 2,3-dioxygenase n=1 Tax=Rhodococcoides trifolii TaxID=908250 RepID=A0A917G7N1_9NOCA|nr:catechol 2,3-dioxygenase [Rhodococcus trifolii]